METRPRKSLNALFDDSGKYLQGVSYYPDYLPETPSLFKHGALLPCTLEEKIDEDLSRMRRAHLSVIRMGEFAWQFLEPSPGEFKPDRFLYTLDRAHENGQKVIFCTPTACPPAWLSATFPESLPEFPEGHKVSFGSRRHYDPTSAAYREAADSIVRKVARTFGNHPAIYLWQLDNEWGHHESAFLWSKRAEVLFQNWLESKYEAIETLNNSWFNTFWSKCYNTFEQIPLPKPTLADHCPSHELDYRRFCTSIYRSLQQEHAQILRQEIEGVTICHNLIPEFFDLCPWEMTEDLDIVGYDHYQLDPTPTPERSLSQFTLMSSLKAEEPFVVLEQQPLQVNWQTLNRRIPFDWLMLWSAQSRALGSIGNLYFSWQRFYGGPEQYHDGIVGHDVRVPRTKQEALLQVIQNLHDKLSSFFKVAGESTKEVLLLFSTESQWTHTITAQSDIYSSLKLIDDLTAGFSRMGLGVSYRSRINDLIEQQVPPTPNHGAPALLVIADYAFELSTEERAWLRAYLSAGGQVLSLPRALQKDASAKAVPLPLSFTEQDSLALLDFGALGAEEQEKVVGKDGVMLYRGQWWAEQPLITENSSEDPPWNELGSYASGIYKDSPALLKRTFGDGCQLHCATTPIVDEHFLKLLQESFSLPRRSDHPAATGVQRIPFSKGELAINFSEKSSALSLPTHKTSSTKVECFTLAQHGAAEFSLETATLSIDSGGEVILPARSISTILW